MAAPCRTIDVCLRVPCSTRPIDQLPPLPQLERKPIPAKQRKKWFPILPHAFDLAYFETVLNLLYGILEGGGFFFSLSFCIASPVPFTCHVCSTSYNSLPSLVPSKPKTNKPCICTLSPTQPLLDSVGVKACIYRLTLTLSHSLSRFAGYVMDSYNKRRSSSSSLLSLALSLALSKGVASKSQVHSIGFSLLTPLKLSKKNLQVSLPFRLPPFLFQPWYHSSMDQLFPIEGIERIDLGKKVPPTFPAPVPTGKERERERERERKRKEEGRCRLLRTCFLSSRDKTRWACYSNLACSFFLLALCYAIHCRSILFSLSLSLLYL